MCVENSNVGADDCAAHTLPAEISLKSLNGNFKKLKITQENKSQVNMCGNTKL